MKPVPTRIMRTEDGPFISFKLADTAPKQAGVIYCDGNKGHKIPRPENFRG